MYLEMAEEEDKKIAEHWQANGEAILIFVGLYPLIPYFTPTHRSKTGLFSAAVASLLSVSIQDLQPNSQDTSNFYLANIYQTLADPDRSNVSSSLPSSPPPFSPPNSAIWVNTLWFLSLVTSISCALLATLLQQWARRYLMVTQPRYSTHKRARIRAFFHEGVEKFALLWVAESLPTLLHTSLFLFFAGLVVFLCSVEFTIFKLTLAWIGFCTTLYGGVTFSPIFYHDCPYYTPYTIFFWQVAIGILDIVYQVRWSFGSPRLHRRVALRRLRDHYHKLNMQGMHKTAEGAALNAPSEIDTRAFMWTFDSLDEDHELERFFSGLPGFRRSRVVVDPLPSLKDEQKYKFSEALRWLLDVTFLSDSLPDPVKKRRAIICAKAVDPANIPDAFGVLHRILSYYQHSGPVATEIVQIVRGWSNNMDEDAILDAQAAISMTVARVQPRDDSWFMLAASALGVSETVLRDYAQNADNLSLAVLIHLTRQQFSHYGKPSWPSLEFSEILEAASKFDVQGTSPKLQHEFCTLWNQIILDNDHSIAFEILGPIRSVYIALHPGTDSVSTRLSPSTGDKDDILRVPSSYLVCNIAGHIHDDSTFTTFPKARTVLHDDAAPAPASHVISQAPPSSSIPAPHYVDESLKYVVPLDNDIYVPGSFHPAHRTAIENLPILAPSPDPVTTCVIQEAIDISNIANPLSTLEPSASPSPPTLMASPFSPGAVAVRHVADRRTSLDVQGGPSLPSPTLVLDNMFPMGPHSSLESPMIRSDHTPSPPESHSSLPAPAAPGPSRPLLSSAPDLGTVAEGEDSAKAALHKERGEPGPPLEFRDNIKMTQDLPPQSSSSSSISDIASTGPLRHSSGAEHTGDQPLHPSHGL